MNSCVKFKVLGFLFSRNLRSRTRWSQIEDFCSQSVTENSEALHSRRKTKTVSFLSTWTLSQFFFSGKTDERTTFNHFALQLCRRRAGNRRDPGHIASLSRKLSCQVWQRYTGGHSELSRCASPVDWWRCAVQHNNG